VLAPKWWFRDSVGIRVVLCQRGGFVNQPTKVLIRDVATELGRTI
jgi:hypothetical protein